MILLHRLVLMKNYAVTMPITRIIRPGLRKLSDSSALIQRDAAYIYTLLAQSALADASSRSWRFLAVAGEACVGPGLWPGTRGNAG